MIVKCEQCQTRFKIPDDKVTDKGVKVRCTKCQHTFRVKKEGDAATPVAAPVDPFDKFGPATGPEPGEETRPAMFALGVQATKSGNLAALSDPFAGNDPGSDPFESPTRVAPVPQPPPGKRPLNEPSPFDFSSLSAAPPAAAPKAKGFEPQPFDFGSLPPASPQPGHSDVTQRAPIPGPPRSSFEPQPFDFSALPPAAEPPPAPKAAESSGRRALAQAKPSSFEPQPFDFSSLGEEAAPRAAAPPPPLPRAAPAPANFDQQPFDFSSLETSAAPPAPPPPPQRVPTKTQAGATRQAPATSAPKPVAPPPRPAPAPPPDFDLGPAMDFGPSEPAAPAPRPRPTPAAVTQPHARTVVPPMPGGGGLLGDIPADPNSLSMERDDGLQASPEARGALFDMPESEPIDNQLQPAEPAEQVAVAKIALKKVAVGQVSKPDEEQVSSSRRPKRSPVAVVWNAVSALVLSGMLVVLLMVVANEGKVDASLSWAKLKALFAKPRELVAFDISNGLYDTRAGKPVFYVRGEVKNRGARAGRVKVKAEILDGEDLMRAAEGYVGATPSPEDLYAVATADDVAKLSARLASSAAPVQPGAEHSFLVVFYEYPPDLKDFRVRVTVTPDDGPTAARF
ncbi:MAG: zinc-ribbon domain-containing protein [Archangiaceae bacterium]|nr:zinc-ribbon domain-containing protein [Archangiaceae bacterium]